jgi:hypothetical protein
MVDGWANFDDLGQKKIMNRKIVFQILAVGFDLIQRMSKVF